MFTPLAVPLASLNQKSRLSQYPHVSLRLLAFAIITSHVHMVHTHRCGWLLRMVSMSVRLP